MWMAREHFVGYAVARLIQRPGDSLSLTVRWPLFSPLPGPGCRHSRRRGRLSAGSATGRDQPPPAVPRPGRPTRSAALARQRRARSRARHESRPPRPPRASDHAARYDDDPGAKRRPLAHDHPGGIPVRGRYIHAEKLRHTSTEAAAALAARAVITRWPATCGSRRCGSLARMPGRGPSGLPSATTLSGPNGTG